MKSFKTSKHRFLISGLVSGLVFALLMALFDYYNEEPFSLWKFLFFFIIMGLLNGYPQYRAYRNLEKNETDKFDHEKHP